MLQYDVVYVYKQDRIEDSVTVHEETKSEKFSRTPKQKKPRFYTMFKVWCHATI